jgi:hypothetical protein
MKIHVLSWRLSSARNRPERYKLLAACAPLLHFSTLIIFNKTFFSDAHESPALLFCSTKKTLHTFYDRRWSPSQKCYPTTLMDRVTFLLLLNLNTDFPCARNSRRLSYGIKSAKCTAPCLWEMGDAEYVLNSPKKLRM